jgi:hypothetical protein
MKFQQYFLSFFVNAESDISQNYLNDLLKFQEKVDSIINAKDVYERALALVVLAEDDNSFLVDIEKKFTIVNYSQHDLVIRILLNLTNSLKTIKGKFYVSRGRDRNRLPTMINTYFYSSDKDKSQSLRTLQFQGTTDSKENHEVLLELEKVCNSNVLELYDNIKLLIRYVKN